MRNLLKSSLSLGLILSILLAFFLNMVFAKEWMRVISRDKRKIMSAIEKLKEDRIAKIYRQKRVQDVTLEHLFKEADCVVMGKVKEIEAKIITDTVYKLEPEPVQAEMKTIITLVTISPTKWLKSSPELEKEWLGDSKEVIINFPGGKVGNLKQYFSFASGTPWFEKNQEVLVFLVKDIEPPYFALFWDARGEYIIEDGKIYNLFHFYQRKDKSLVSLKSFLEEIEKIKGGEK
ncbi:MAG: hypothetical protein QME40_01545 [bacterium]|nr:hypothetical protein [bacterium]